jgi:hypothetical protein
MEAVLTNFRNSLRCQKFAERQSGLRSGIARLAVQHLWSFGSAGELVDSRARRTRDTTSVIRCWHAGAPSGRRGIRRRSNAPNRQTSLRSRERGAAGLGLAVTVRADEHARATAERASSARQSLSQRPAWALRPRFLDRFPALDSALRRCDRSGFLVHHASERLAGAHAVSLRADATRSGRACSVTGFAGFTGSERVPFRRGLTPHSGSYHRPIVGSVLSLRAAAMSSRGFLHDPNFPIRRKRSFRRVS